MPKSLPPMQLQSGEVPADLLGRMAQENGPERPRTAPNDPIGPSTK
jgi:hypothetical protein